MQKWVVPSYIIPGLYLWLVLLCYISFAACGNGQQERTLASQQSAVQKDVFIDLSAFLQNQGRFKPVDVNVQYDPVFKKEKQYTGYSLVEILDSVMRLHQLDQSNTVVVFVCRDGYQPSMTVNEILGNEKGYIVFKDRSITGAANWPTSVAEKFPPYYLVWERMKNEDQVHVWPFGLTGLRLTSWAAFYNAIYPPKRHKAAGRLCLI